MAKLYPLEIAPDLVRGCDAPTPGLAAAGAAIEGECKLGECPTVAEETWCDCDLVNSELRTVLQH